MEIIKRGKIPHYKYKFKCNKCKTVFIVEKKDIFTKKIKYFEED